MCIMLSDMMRYISSFLEGPVFLSDEIAHTINYLKLQKWRYKDLLDYSIDIPEEMHKVRLPRLTIQPFVENCFSHAFKGIRPPFHISITGKIQSNNWRMEIIDNGCGFNPDAKKQVFTKLGNYLQDASEGNLLKYSEFGGLGIINVAARLEMLYGSSTIFLVEDAPSKGTIILLGGEFK
jgi:two-component system sensor histidine kinase YesM